MDFSYELERQSQGYTRICGVDEAGRGPLAGPIVAAAVILRADALVGLETVNDSKQLTAARREDLSQKIVDQAVAWHVEEISAAEIDSFGISIANALVAQRAVQLLQPAADYVLADKMSGLKLRIPFETIIDGDALVLSIAAASILAKVHRDRLMVTFHQQYPEYGFDQHKGYGTEIHIAAIKKYGPCPIHRMTFEPLRPKLF
jgi:ribonuclease HII